MPSWPAPLPSPTARTRRGGGASWRGGGKRGSERRKQRRSGAAGAPRRRPSPQNRASCRDRHGDARSTARRGARPERDRGIGGSSRLPGGGAGAGTPGALARARAVGGIGLAASCHSSSSDNNVDADRRGSQGAEDRRVTAAPSVPRTAPQEWQRPSGSIMHEPSPWGGDEGGLSAPSSPKSVARVSTM